jgi:hypothetical protein
MSGTSVVASRGCLANTPGDHHGLVVGRAVAYGTTEPRSRAGECAESLRPCVTPAERGGYVHSRPRPLTPRQVNWAPADEHAGPSLRGEDLSADRGHMRAEA